MDFVALVAPRPPPRTLHSHVSVPDRNNNTSSSGSADNVLFKKGTHISLTNNVQRASKATPATDRQFQRAVCDGAFDDDLGLDDDTLDMFSTRTELEQKLETQHEAVNEMQHAYSPEQIIETVNDQLVPAEDERASSTSRCEEDTTSSTSIAWGPTRMSRSTSSSTCEFFSCSSQSSDDGRVLMDEHVRASLQSALLKRKQHLAPALPDDLSFVSVDTLQSMDSIDSDFSRDDETRRSFSESCSKLKQSLTFTSSTPARSHSGHLEAVPRDQSDPANVSFLLTNSYTDLNL